MKNFQKYDSNQPIVIILDDLKEQEVINPRVQTMFKRYEHSNILTILISQDNYWTPKKTVRANGNNYQIFKPKNFRDVRNLYQDKASMDMTIKEYKILTSICWNAKFRPVTIDITKDKHTD